MIDYKKKYQKYKKKYALLCKLGGMLDPSQYKDTRCTFSPSGGLPLSIISANILHKELFKDIADPETFCTGVFHAIKQVSSIFISFHSKNASGISTYSDTLNQMILRQNIYKELGFSEEEELMKTMNYGITYYQNEYNRGEYSELKKTEETLKQIEEQIITQLIERGNLMDKFMELLSIEASNIGDLDTKLYHPNPHEEPIPLRDDLDLLFKMNGGKLTKKEFIEALGKLQLPKLFKKLMCYDIFFDEETKYEETKLEIEKRATHEFDTAISIMLEKIKQLPECKQVISSQNIKDYGLEFLTLLNAIDNDTKRIFYSTLKNEKITECDLIKIFTPVFEEYKKIKIWEEMKRLTNITIYRVIYAVYLHKLTQQQKKHTPTEKKHIEPLGCVSKEYILHYVENMADCDIKNIMSYRGLFNITIDRTDMKNFGISLYSILDDLDIKIRENLIGEHGVLVSTEIEFVLNRIKFGDGGEWIDIGVPQNNFNRLSTIVHSSGISDLEKLMQELLQITIYGKKDTKYGKRVRRVIVVFIIKELSKIEPSISQKTFLEMFNTMFASSNKLHPLPLLRQNSFKMFVENTSKAKLEEDEDKSYVDGSQISIKEEKYDIPSSTNMSYDAIISESIEGPSVCDMSNILLLNNRALIGHVRTQCKQLLSKKDEIDKLGGERGFTRKQLIDEAQRLGIFYQIYNPEDPKQKHLIDFHTDGTARVNAELIKLALNHLKEEKKIQTNIHICLLALNDSDFNQLIIGLKLNDSDFNQLIIGLKLNDPNFPYELLAQNINQIIDFMNTEKNNFIQQNGEEKFPFTDKTFNSSVHIAMANILSATIAEELLVRCDTVKKWYTRTRQLYELLGIELKDFSIFVAPVLRNVIEFEVPELSKVLKGIQLSSNMLQF